MKDGDTFVILDGDVENEAADAGDGHGDDDGRPAVKEHFVDEGIPVSKVKAEWRHEKEENARDHDRGRPGGLVEEERERRKWEREELKMRK